VFLTAVVWAMVVKPIGNAGWFWGALVVTALAVAAVVGDYLRGSESGVPTVPTTD
jgi:hypothetical protein